MKLNQIHCIIFNSIQTKKMINIYSTYPFFIAFIAASSVGIKLFLILFSQLCFNTLSRVLWKKASAEEEARTPTLTSFPRTLNRHENYLLFLVLLKSIQLHKKSVHIHIHPSILTSIYDLYPYIHPFIHLSFYLVYIHGIHPLFVISFMPYNYVI